jgi:hypothetical protein
MCLTLLLAIASQWHSYEIFTSYKMEHRHGFRRAFVRGVTTVLLLGGLGVEDQIYGLREVPILLLVACYFRLGQRCSPRKKTKSLEEKLMVLMRLFLLIS